MCQVFLDTCQQVKLTPTACESHEHTRRIAAPKSQYRSSRSDPPEYEKAPDLPPEDT